MKQKTKFKVNLKMMDLMIEIAKIIRILLYFFLVD